MSMLSQIGQVMGMVFWGWAGCDARSIPQGANGTHDRHHHHPRIPGRPFLFREDGYFNMTKAAEAFGKRVPKFQELPSTANYLKAYCAAHNVQKSDVWIAKRGKGGGTWAHPKLAVFFARWLDVRFAV